MIDFKVYKTDYESEFTEFFKQLSDEDAQETKGVSSEIKTYERIIKLRDNADIANSRIKLWQDF